MMFSLQLLLLAGHSAVLWMVSKFSNENIYRILIFAVERLHCVCVTHHCLDQVYSCVDGLLPFGVQLDYRADNCRYEAGFISFLFFTGEIEFIVFIPDRTV